MGFIKYWLMVIGLFAGVLYMLPQKNSELKVTSNSFADKGAIPSECAYDHENISPHIAWSTGPQGTQSYVLICQDPDAPSKEPWVHWVVFNIPVGTTELASGIQGLEQGRNDFKKIGWGGPKPPSGTHRYRFDLYALDSDLPELVGKNPTKSELLQAMKSHKFLAQGELMGTYSA